MRIFSLVLVFMVFGLAACHAEDVDGDILYIPIFKGRPSPETGVVVPSASAVRLKKKLEELKSLQIELVLRTKGEQFQKVLVELQRQKTAQAEDKAKHYEHLAQTAETAAVSQRRENRILKALFALKLVFGLF
mgnify:FL=1